MEIFLLDFLKSTFSVDRRVILTVRGGGGGKTSATREFEGRFSGIWPSDSAEHAVKERFSKWFV